MTRPFVLAIFVALAALALVSACVSPPGGEWTEDAIARRERIVELSAKAAAARLVEKDVAKPEDLVLAANVIEAAVVGSYPEALQAAGLEDPEWELFALLIEERLEPYRLEPFAARMIAAAARGVRAGAGGEIPAEEVEELEELERVAARDRPKRARGVRAA